MTSTLSISSKTNISVYGNNNKINAWIKNIITDKPIVKYFMLLLYVMNVICAFQVGIIPVINETLNIFDLPYNFQLNYKMEWLQAMLLFMLIYFKIKKHYIYMCVFTLIFFATFFFNVLAEITNFSWLIYSMSMILSIKLLDLYEKFIEKN